MQRSESHSLTAAGPPGLGVFRRKSYLHQGPLPPPGRSAPQPLASPPEPASRSLWRGWKRQSRAAAATGKARWYTAGAHVRSWNQPQIRGQGSCLPPRVAARLCASEPVEEAAPQVTAFPERVWEAHTVGV